MKRFVAFVKKEALHIVRDPRTLLVLFCIPILQIVLFGFALSTEVKIVRFAVCAPHPSNSIRQLTERIAANPYFTFVGNVTQPEIEPTLRRGDANIVVVFDNNVERTDKNIKQNSSIQLVVDAVNPVTSLAATGYMQSILQSPPMGDALVASAPSPLGRAGVGLVSHMLYNPQMLSAHNFVPGLMGMVFILICAIMTSISIVREKETGTMEILLVSPVRAVNVVIAKMIPYFALSCIVFTVIMLLSVFLLHVPVEGSLAAITGVSLLYILLSLSLGLLISSLANRQIVALLVSVAVLIFPIVMLSGLLFPIENLPKFFQWLSCLIPARWYIDAIKKLMIEGVPFVTVLKQVAILAGMTVVLIGVSLKKFNNRLE